MSRVRLGDFCLCDEVGAQDSAAESAQNSSEADRRSKPVAADSFWRRGDQSDCVRTNAVVTPHAGAHRGDFASQVRRTALERSFRP